MKVFIADDSDVVRDRLIEMISEIKGVEITGQARTASEAIQAIVKLKPDVVVLDIRMPAGNGIHVLEMIKKLKLDAKIIMLTNYPYPQYRQKCFKAGADFFFDKDTEFVQVSEVLKDLINKASDGNGKEI